MILSGECDYIWIISFAIHQRFILLNDIFFVFLQTEQKNKNNKGKKVEHVIIRSQIILSLLFEAPSSNPIKHKIYFFLLMNLPRFISTNE